MNEDRPIGAREAARRRVSGALAVAARSLVAENGYDDTTIEMIAERAGVSRRTFFRHFETKDAVLLHFYDDLGEKIAAAVEAAPDDMPPMLALAESFRVVEVFLSDPVEQASQSNLIQTIAESPRLDAARNYRRRHNIERAARALVEREQRRGRQMSALEAGAIAGSTFSCLYAAEQVYLRDTTQDPVELYREAAAAVYDAMTASYAYQEPDAATIAS